MASSRLPLVALLAAGLGALASAQSWSAGATFIKAWVSEKPSDSQILRAKDGGAFRITFAGDDYRTIGYDRAYSYAAGGYQLTRYDATGGLAWSRRILGTSIPTSEGGQCMVGFAEWSGGVYVAGSIDRAYPSGEQLFLVKYDSSGNIVWRRFFTPKDQPRMMAGSVSLTVDANDNAYLLAAVGWGNYNRGALSKWGPDGSLLLDQTLLAANYQELRSLSMQQAPDGSLLFAGEGKPAGGAFQAFVTKLDSSLKLSWLRTPSYTEAPRVYLGADGSACLMNSGSRFMRYSAAGDLVYTKDFAQAYKFVSCDSSGNAYLTGNSGMIGVNGVFTKLSPAGVVLWTKSREVGFDPIGGDASGKTFLTCRDAGPNYSPLLTSFDSAGNQAWVKPISSFFGAEQSVSATYGLGDVMLTSFIRGELEILTTRVTPTGVAAWTSAPLRSDAMWVKYVRGAVDPEGNTFLWGGNDNGTRPQTYSDHSWVAQIGANGQFLFSKEQAEQGDQNKPAKGNVRRVLAYPGGGFVVASVQSVRRYDATGKVAWMATLDPWVDGAIADIVLDASGNVLGMTSVGGAYNNAAPVAFKINPQGGWSWKTKLPNTFLNCMKVGSDSTGAMYGFDFALGRIKYGPAGSLHWTYQSQLPGTSFRARDAVVDPTGNLYVACTFFTGELNSAIIKYNSNGGQLWSAPFQCSGIPVPRRLAVDPAGLVYVVGDDIIGPDQFSRFQHLRVEKLSTTGVVAWSVSPPELGTSSANDVKIDPQGRILAAGWTYTSSFDDLLARFTPAGALDRWQRYDSGQTLPEQPGGLFGGNGSAPLDATYYGQERGPGSLGLDKFGNAYLYGSVIGPTGGYELHRLKFSDDSAQPATQTIPTSMTAGQTYSVIVEMKNAGTTSWTAAGGYRLACVQGSVWGKPFVDLSGSDNIAPGQTKRFSFSVYAPTSGGTYPMQWRMDHQGQYSGAVTTLVQIPVTLRQNAARYLSQTVPSTVKAGSTFTVTVKMRNVGTTSWTVASGFKLATTDPDMNATWGTVSVPLAAGDSIAQGQDKTFTFTCTAPTTPGAYTMRWRMRRDAASFTGMLGDKTTTKGITVTP